MQRDAGERLILIKEVEIFLLERWDKGKSGRKLKLLICTRNYFAREDFKAAFDFCDHVSLFQITNGYVKWKKKKKSNQEKTLKTFSPLSSFLQSLRESF